MRLHTYFGAALLGLAACATAEPEQKPPQKDEFQGFAALRGEPREKKKAEDRSEKADGAKGDKDKAGAGEEETALSKDQVLSAIATGEKRFNGCLKKHKDPGIYVVQITIAPDGTCAVEPVRAPTRKEDPELWSDVEPGIDAGKNPKSPTSRCLATAMTQVRFPAFEGKPLVVTYPIFLR